MEQEKHILNSAQTHMDTWSPKKLSSVLQNSNDNNIISVTNQFLNQFYYLSKKTTNSIKQQQLLLN